MTQTAAYAAPLDMGSLREYVTGASRGMQQAAESTVLLLITHNHLKAKFPEIRLDKHVRRQLAAEPGGGVAQGVGRCSGAAARADRAPLGPWRARGACARLQAPAPAPGPRR